MNWEHWIEFAALLVPHVAQISGQYDVDGTKFVVFAVFDPIRYTEEATVAASLPDAPAAPSVNVPLV